MKRLLQAYRCPDSSEARQQLRQWSLEPLGEAVLQSEQALVRQVLQRLFGYHLLQLGDTYDSSVMAESRIAHRMIMLDGSEQMDEPLTGIEYLRGLGGQLPVASDTLDAVLLPHYLEFEPEPHQLLREVERVLIPEGHVLITGFNPLSQFGVLRLLQGWRHRAPWSGHFYTPMRLRDWLSLLGFDTVLQRHFFYRPPLRHQPSMERLQFMDSWGERLWPPLGAGYLLLAKKRVATITPIRPRWRVARRLINVGVTEPSARRDKM